MIPKGQKDPFKGFMIDTDTDHLGSKKTFSGLMSASHAGQSREEGLTFHKRLSGGGFLFQRY